MENGKLEQKQDGMYVDSFELSISSILEIFVGGRFKYSFMSNKIEEQTFGSMVMVCFKIVLKCLVKALK